MKIHHQIIGLSAALAFLCACGQRNEGVRHYSEVNSLPLESAPAASAGGSGMTAAAAPFMNQPAPTVPLAWTTPDGWTEKPGAGVRLVMFDASGVECAIIAFPAMMAGAPTEAKVGIWLQQLGASAQQTELVSFVAKPSKVAGSGGIAVEVYDFADLLGADVPASMVAGLFKVGDTALSIRMKGAPKAVAEQKAKFVALCESLRKKE